MGIDDRILHSQAKRLLLQHYFFHLEGRSAVTVTDTSEGREPVFFWISVRASGPLLKSPSVLIKTFITVQLHTL